MARRIGEGAGDNKRLQWRKAVLQTYVFELGDNCQDSPVGKAVVVIQEIFGVNADPRAACNELAASGLIAISPDPSTGCYVESDAIGLDGGNNT